jgi:uncharacterized protein (UPF0332 family)
MPFVDDLLDQAAALVTQEPRRPKQASLRRAVSAAYYALFHAVVKASAATVLLGRPSGDRLEARLRRIVSHAAVKRAAGWFLPGAATPQAVTSILSGSTPPVDLERLCQILVDLQSERHRADYDLSAPFDRAEAKRLVSDARKAIHHLQSVPESDSKRVFLLGCMLGEQFVRNP